ncbi:Protein SODIUM POTASSIUM ROOT DEFECTIVE 2 [Vigna angularis]|uniref:Protein SODIUM POTASSIUM ROOT DEFECTIVE 2 n=3 Tax=Phaseolus angularis TaxID=3914 RepID=A0A8T0JHB5_PHAAN|nr:Protein SODIUM POTASSIUM ROOT DEFECTIVE 2 [Vigna angularis]
MKGMKLFCCSTASTAVNSTTRSTVRRSTKRHTGVRRKIQPRLPCSSVLPMNPLPHSDARRKGSVSNFNFSSSKNSSGSSSSTIYLLGDWVSDSDQIPSHKPTLQNHVVLRVSLHCRACEGKVRKHISKMEGVTSFSIDMEDKKVTVIGDVTPLEVLASVSKVKNAQLWQSPKSSLPSTAEGESDAFRHLNPLR